jgi:hypothetical protein
VSSTNRDRTTALAEAIATERARAAHHLSEQGQVATAHTLLRQARGNRILALRLRSTYEPSLSQSRLRGLCFCGTLSPSRRQMR